MNIESDSTAPLPPEGDFPELGYLWKQTEFYLYSNRLRYLRFLSVTALLRMAILVGLFIGIGSLVSLLESSKLLFAGLLSVYLALEVLNWLVQAKRADKYLSRPKETY